MKAVGVVAPARTVAASGALSCGAGLFAAARTAGARRGTVVKNIAGNYETAIVASFPRMTHLRPLPNGGGAWKICVSSILSRNAKKIFRIAAYFGGVSRYGASRDIRNIGYLSESLFRSYAALNQLTQALWRIYRSNDLQLRNSLLGLIRTINEKSGTELGVYLKGFTNFVRSREKIAVAMKRVDRSLVRRFSELGGVLTVMNTHRRELYRRADSAALAGVKTASEITRHIVGLYAMTPLLTRIYEGIETGVYLYGADSYRNAKTLRRLTNSLWKVYLGQNMELSRSFSRLITRVNRENKSFETRIAENNMFSDDRSLKHLVNALRRAFSGSNLELRSSMISLFGDIRNADRRRSSAVNNYGGARNVGITIVFREVVPERGHIRLDHRSSARSSSAERERVYDRVEREIKTSRERLDTAFSRGNAGSAEDIVGEALERLEKKQRLDWRLEKLQRGLF